MLWTLKFKCAVNHVSDASEFAGANCTAKITGIDLYSFPHSLCGSVYMYDDNF